MWVLAGEAAGDVELEKRGNETAGKYMVYSPVTEHFEKVNDTLPIDSPALPNASHSIYNALLVD